MNIFCLVDVPKIPEASFFIAKDTHPFDKNIISGSKEAWPLDFYFCSLTASSLSLSKMF